MHFIISYLNTLSKSLPSWLKLCPFIIIIAVSLFYACIRLNLSHQVYPAITIETQALSGNTDTSSNLDTQYKATTIDYYPVVLNHKTFTLSKSKISSNAPPFDTIEVKALKINGKTYPINDFWVKQSVTDVSNGHSFTQLIKAESLLYEAIGQDVVVIDISNKSYQIDFFKRRLSDTTVTFWLYSLVGLLSLTLAVIAIYLRPLNRYTFAYLFASICLALGSLMNISALSRDWAIDPHIFHWHFYLENLALRLFICSTLYLVWHLPYHIGRKTIFSYLPWAVSVAMIISWFTHVLGIYSQFKWFIFSPALVFSTLVVLSIFLQWGLAYSKYIATHRLVDKIALRWLIANVIVCSFFGFGQRFLHLYDYIDMPNTDLIWLSTALVFQIGITALLLRSKLYYLETWWWQAWGLLGALTMSLAIYVILMELDYKFSEVTVSIMIFSSLLTYLLIKTYFRHYFAKNNVSMLQRIIPQLIDIVGDFNDTKQAHINWCQVLQDTFQPLSMNSHTKISGEASKNGLPSGHVSFENQVITTLPSVTQPAMTQPNRSLNIDNSCPVGIYNDGELMITLGLTDELIVMQGAASGLRLFTKNDVQRVSLFWRIISQGQLEQEAYCEGETFERVQIAADLRDDIGGKLLCMMAIGGKDGKYAESTLQNLNMLTQGLYGANENLSNLLADINYSIEECCEVCSIKYTYDICIDLIEDKLLPAHSASLLNALLNELLRNAIQHEYTTKIDFKLYIENKKLFILVENDGLQTNPEAWKKGLGMTSIRRRVHNVSGKVTWQPLTSGGVLCSIEFELQKWLTL